jgi:hypothetical protein
VKASHVTSPCEAFEFLKHSTVAIFLFLLSAYISQLLLNSLGALQKEAEAREEAEEKAEADRLHNAIIATSRLFNEKRASEQSSATPPTPETPADVQRDRPEPKPRPENPTYADLRT